METYPSTGGGRREDDDEVLSAGLSSSSPQFLAVAAMGAGDNGGGDKPSGFTLGRRKWDDREEEDSGYPLPPPEYINQGGDVEDAGLSNPIQEPPSRDHDASTLSLQDLEISGVQQDLIRCVEDEETANILLAHVTQLRSLWRFEHEQSAALRDLVGRKEAELEGCLTDLQQTKSFVSFINDQLLYSTPITPPLLFAHASQLLLGAVDAEYVRLYAVTPEGNQLLTYDQDTNNEHMVEVVEEVGSGVVGFAALTEDPLFIGPLDQRLLFCRKPPLVGNLTSALLFRVTDQKGDVVGVVEVFNKSEEGGFVAEDAQALLSLEDYLVAVLRLVKVMKDMEELSYQNKEAVMLRAMCRDLMRQSLLALCTGVLRAEDGAIFVLDAERSLAVVAVSAVQEEAQVVMPLDSSDVGHVLTTGSTLLLPPSDQGPSELCVALRNADGHVVGAVQFTNKLSEGGFTAHDKYLVECSAQCLGVLVTAYLSLPGALDEGGLEQLPLALDAALKSPSQASGSYVSNKAWRHNNMEAGESPLLPSARSYPPIPRPPPSISDSTQLKEDLLRAQQEIQRLQADLARERAAAALSPLNRRRSSAQASLAPHRGSISAPTTPLVPSRGVEVDQEGIGRRGSTASTSQQDEQFLMSPQEVEALRLVEILGSDMNLRVAFRHVEAQTQHLLQCQRVVVWLYESGTQRLWAPSLEGHGAILTTSSLPGYVANKGQMVRLDEASRDPRFSPEVDDLLSLRTHTLLCAPIKSHRGEVLGVLQAINAFDGAFTTTSEDTAAVIARHLGMVSGRCRQMIDTYEELDKLLGQHDHHLKSTGVLQSELNNMRAAGVAYEEATRQQAETLASMREKYERIHGVKQLQEGDLAKLRAEYSRMEDTNRQLEAEVEQLLTEQEGLTRDHERSLQRTQELSEELERLKSDFDMSRTTFATELETGKAMNLELQRLQEEQDRMAERVRRSEVVLRILDDLRSEVRLVSMLERLLAQLRDVTGATNGAVYLYDRRRQVLMNPLSEQSDRGRIPATMGILGHTARTGDTLNLSDASRDVRYHRDIDEIRGSITHTMLSVAVMDQAKNVMAVVHLTNKHTGPFTEGDQTILEELAGHLTGPVARCLGYEEELRGRELETRQLNEELVLTNQRLEEEMNNAVEEQATLEEKIAEAKAAWDDKAKEVAALLGQLNTERDKRSEAEKESERLNKELADSLRQRDRLGLVMGLITTLENELRLDSIVAALTTHIQDSFHAQDCLLWFYDRDKRELYTPRTEIMEGPRLPSSSGIAGFVARTGDAVCLGDAYKDPRFNPDVDERKGTITRTILSGPIRDHRGEVMGVVQILNRLEGIFDGEDIERLNDMAGVALGAVLSRAVKHEGLSNSWRDQIDAATGELVKAQRLLEDQQDVVKQMEAQLAEHKLTTAGLEARIQLDTETLKASLAWGYCLNLTQLVDQMQSQASRLLQVQGVTCYLLDEAKQELWAAGGGQDNAGSALRYSISSSSIPCHVARTGEVLVVEDVNKDLRFNRDREERMGITVRNVCCGPLLDARGELIGVLEAYNKGGAFSGSDIELMRLLMAQVGVHVKRCMSWSEEARELQSHIEEMRAAQERLEDSLGESTSQVAQLHAVVDEGDRDKAVLQAKMEGLTQMLRWSDALGREASLSSLLSRLGLYTKDLLRCEDAKMFLLNSDKQEFWTNGEGGQAVHIPLAMSGILSLVSKTGKILRVRDTASDPLFSEELMGSLGVIKARNLMCGAIRDPNGEVLGVFQAYNKMEGEFDVNDEGVMNEMVRYLGVAVGRCLHLGRESSSLEQQAAISSAEAARITEMLTSQQAAMKHLQKDFDLLQSQATISKTQAKRFAELLEVHGSIESDLELRPTLSRLCIAIQQLLRVERASVFIVDLEGKTLWLPNVGAGEEEVRLPLAVGVLGQVVQTQEVVRLDNAYKDPRFSRDVDEKLRIASRAVMCLPIVDNEDENQVLGVLQLSNKEEGGSFTDEEETWATEVVNQLSSVVKRALAYEKEKREWEGTVQGVKECLGRTVAPLEWPVKDVVTLCQAATSQLCEILDVNLATMMLVDHQENEVYLPGEEGDLHVLIPGMEDLEESHITGKAVPLDPRVWDHVITRHQPLYVPERRTSNLESYQYKFQGRGSISSMTPVSPLPGRRGSWALSIKADGTSSGATRTLTEERDCLYMPLCLMPLRDSVVSFEGAKRCVGVIKVVGKRRSRGFTEQDIHTLTVVGGHLALALHGYLANAAQVQGRVNEHVTEFQKQTSKATLLLAQTVALMQANCTLPTFAKSLQSLATERTRGSLRRRRPSICTSTSLSRSPAHPRRSVDMTIMGKLPLPSLLGFGESFRRLVCSLLSCNDVALVVDVEQLGLDGGKVKGVPLSLVERVSKEREMLRWPPLDAQGRVVRDKRARSKGGEEEDDMEGEEEEEEQESLRALCLPVLVSSEAIKAGVLVVVWYAEGDGSNQEGEQVKAELAGLLAHVLGLALVASTSASTDSDGGASALSNAAERAIAVKEPVLEVVERLLRVQQVPDLFEAVPAALTSWLPTALTRLYLLDPSSQAPNHQLFTIVGRGGEAATVNVPISAGILGHVARSGVTEYLNQAPYSHMFFDPNIDRCECELVQLPSPSSDDSFSSSSGSSPNRFVCLYCQEHGNPRVRKELMVMPEARRAWETYHLNVPRLYLPLRNHDDGIVAGVVKVEFVGIPSDIAPSSIGAVNRDQLDYLVARARRVLPVLEAGVSRCVRLSSMSKTVAEADAMIKEANRYDEVLKIGQEASCVRKLDALSQLCSNEVAKLLGADRATLFIADMEKKQLYSASAFRAGPWSSSTSPTSFTSTAPPVVVPMGEGIVGYVAATGRPLRLPEDQEEGSSYVIGSGDSLLGQALSFRKCRGPEASTGTSGGGSSSHMDLSSGHSVRINLDGQGYSTHSVLCVPITIITTTSRDKDKTRLVGVLMLQNRQGDPGHFTRMDQELAIKLCGFLGGSIQSCLLSEQLFKQSIVTKVVNTILRLPDHTLADASALSLRLGDVLSKLLEVDGCRLYFVTSKRDGGSGGGKGSEVSLLSPAEEGVDKDGKKRSRRKIEVGGGSITEEAMMTGKAVVVEDVRDDNRYNRSCDRSDAYLEATVYHVVKEVFCLVLNVDHQSGVVAIRKRRCLPGGRVQHGNKYLGVLQVQASQETLASRGRRTTSNGNGGSRGKRFGLLDCSVRDACAILDELSMVLGFVLEWSLQGVSWVRRTKALLQGSSALIGSIGDAAPAFKWVADMVPKISGADRAALFLLDKSTGELRSLGSDGSEIIIRPGEESLPGRVIKSGHVLLQRPFSNIDDDDLRNEEDEQEDLTSQIMSVLQDRVVVVPEVEGRGVDPLHIIGQQSAAICSPVKTSLTGEVVGALLVVVEGVRPQQLDLDGLDHICELVGITIERLQSRQRVAAKLKEREDHYEDKVKRAESELQQLQEELLEITARQEVLRQENESLRDSADLVVDLKTRQEIIRQENEQLKATAELMADLKFKQDELRKENERLKKEVESMSSLRIQQGLLSQENEQLKEDAVVLRQGVELKDHYQYELDKANQESKRLRKERDALMIKVKEYKAQRKKLMELSSQKTMVDEQLERVNARLSEMESEIVDSKLDKDRALRELHQARESKEVITEELRQLRSKLRLAEEETTALRRHLEATGKAMEKEMSELEALRKENHALRSHHGTLQKGLRTLAKLESQEVRRWLEENP